MTGSNPGPRAVNPTPPVRLRALASEDWRFLASLCDRDAREHLEAALGNGAWDGGGGEKITREAAEHRRAMDAFVAARVEEYSVDATRKGETEQRRSAAESASVSEGSPPRTFAEKMRMKRAAAAAARRRRRIDSPETAPRAGVLEVDVVQISLVQSSRSARAPVRASLVQYEM